jgi:diaminopimelate epimerase
VLPGGTVSLKMKDVESLENMNNDFVLNTGSPHYVAFVNYVERFDVFNEARKIRYSNRFEKEGINVNFVEKKSDREIFVRTYERGVEDETLSCGTGVVASALSFAAKNGQLLQQVYIETLGGKLEVRFETAGRGFKNIYLIGPAERVFEGEVEI